MEPLTPDLWSSIERYVAGTASPVECAAVERSMAEDADYLVLVGVLRQAWDDQLYMSRRWNATAAYGRWIAKRAASHQRMTDAAPVRIPSWSSWKVRSIMPRPLSQSIWSISLAAIAAALLLVAGVGGPLSNLIHPTRHTVTTYTTTAGERANITLPDGSHVTLNVGSQLEVPMDFAHGNRTLRLVNGEALFTVTHHDGVPFTVVSGPTTTRVLGTTFLVRRYATDTMTTIAVQDGKVAMRSVVLTAQQQLTVDRTGAMQVQLADDEQFAFATGVLALRYMPLANAIPELNRWFDADVRLGDAALGTRGIRGKFLAGSRADLAADLEMMFDVRVVRDGRILTLFPRR